MPLLISLYSKLIVDNELKCHSSSGQRKQFRNIVGVNSIISKLLDAAH